MTPYNKPAPRGAVGPPGVPTESLEAEAAALKKLAGMQADAEASGISLRTVASKLVKGSAIYGSANFGLRGMNFLLVALYTRYLTPDDYGAIALAETVAIVFTAIFGLGLSTGIQRLYFHYKDDPVELKRYLSTLLWSVLSLAVFSAALALLAGPPLMRIFAPHFSVPFFPFIALAVSSASALLLVENRLGLYQVEGAAPKNAMLAATSFLLTASAIVYFVVVARAGASGMLLGKLVAAVATALISLFLLRSWMTSGFEWKYLRETLPISLPIVPHSVMALGLVVADRFILQKYRDLNEVGLYSLAYTFGMAMFLVTTTLTQAWSPLFYDAASKGEAAKDTMGRLSSTLVFVLVAVACIGALISRDFVRLFLDRRFFGAGIIIPWVIAGYLLHGLYSLFQFSLLQGKRTTFLWVVSAFSLAVNIVFNFLLVPKYGALGAAYATVIGYGVEALLLYIYGQRVYHVRYDLPRIIAALAVFAGALAWAQVAWPDHLRLLMTAAGLFGSLAMVWAISGARPSQLKKLFSGGS